MAKECSKPKEDPIPITNQKEPYWVSIVTMYRAMELRARRAPRVPGTKILYFDGNSGEYFDWLPPGWVAQERYMPTGRVYRYYYDPSGFQYDRDDDARDAIEDMEGVPADAKKFAAVGESSGVSNEKEEAPVV